MEHMYTSSHYVLLHTTYNIPVLDFHNTHDHTTLPNT